MSLGPEGIKMGWTAYDKDSYKAGEKNRGWKLTMYARSVQAT